ncbi:MAG: hypothetical protein EP332_01275 [Bacteroidetes bacterium]|nr:MAG: hypothetical protein EP332_01275 [Bacteroidota bacterium]
MKPLRYKVTHDPSLGNDALITSEQFLEVFETFPWEAEWKRTENSEEEYPAITIYHSDEHYLEIAREENNRVRFFYRNQDTSNDWYFEVDPGKVDSYRQMQQLVADFYSGKLSKQEGHKITPSPETQVFTPKLNYGFLGLFSSLLIIVPSHLGIILFNSENMDPYIIWFVFLFAGAVLLFILPPGILILSYYFNDKRAEWNIDWKTKTLYLLHEQEKRAIPFTEMQFVDVCRQPKVDKRIFELSFLRIQTATRCYYLSSLSAETEKLATRLSKKPRERVFVYPYLRSSIPTQRELRAKQKKENRFFHRYKHKDEAFLKNIVSNPGTHHEVAVAAAKRVLAERKGD